MSNNIRDIVCPECKNAGEMVDKPIRTDGTMSQVPNLFCPNCQIIWVI